MLKSGWQLMIRAVVLLGMIAITVSPAAASDPTGVVNPCAVNDICIVVTDPGGTASPGAPDPGASGGSAGGVQMCSWNGQAWPCWDNDLGWFSSSDGCYYHLENPQPPAGDPEWGGNDPAKGAMYEVNCRQVGGGLSPKPPEFFATPPVGPPPADNPVALAQTAFSKIHFELPKPHTAPVGTAVVGSPVWLWYDRTPGSAGPLSATAQGRTISVTVTAELAKVHWDTGDGSPGVDCATSGTAYTQGADVNATDCKYVYRTGSALQQPDHAYYLTAVATWNISVKVVGAQNKIPDYTRQFSNDQPLPLRVGEMQVLNN